MLKQLAFAIAVASTTLWVGVAQAQLVNGLQTYWNLDGNLLDTPFTGDVGTNHDGTAVGTAAYTTGMFGQGADFQPGGSGTWYVDAANSGTLATGDMSFSTWFRSDGFTTSWQALAAKGEGSKFRTHRSSGSNNIAFNAGAAGDTTFSQNVNNDGPGNIHHLLLTHDNTSGINTIYLDGVATSSGGHTGINGSGTFSLARNPDAVNRQWHGLIDDAAVWNRVVTPAEADEIYGLGLAGNDLGTILNGNAIVEVAGDNTIGTDVNSSGSLFDATYIFEIDGTNSIADLIQVTSGGALDIDGTSIEIELLAGTEGDLADGDTFQLFDAPNGFSGDLLGVTLPEISGDGFAFNIDASNLLVDGTVTVNGVPEPTSLLLWSLLGVAGFLGVRRIRRQK